MRRCPYCSAQIADDSRFCSVCGKEITKANVCPHCGASVGEGDAFCQNCGKSLNEAPSSEPITYEEEQSKSGFKKYLPYIIGAVLLLAIIGYFSSKDSKEGNETQTEKISNEAQSTTNQFVGKVYKGRGTGEGMGITMTINFINGEECLCESDWYGAYSPNKEIKCPYEVKDNHVIVHVNDDGTKFDLDFQIANNGNTIGFTNSERDFLTLELSDGKEETEQGTSETVIDDNSDNNSYTNGSSNNQAEVSDVLSECESQIRSIQSEIESLCNTYVQLISRGDADEFKHERMRMTLIRGVGEWQSKANTVFDRCIRKLNSLGETNAADRKQQEKSEFYSAAERIKNQTLQRTGDDYYN